MYPVVFTKAGYFKGFLHIKQDLLVTRGLNEGPINFLTL